VSAPDRATLCTALAFVVEHLAARERWWLARGRAVDERERPCHSLSKRAAKRSLRGALELAAAQPFRGKLTLRAGDNDSVAFDSAETSEAFFALLFELERRFGAPWFDLEQFNETATHASLMRRIERVRSECGCGSQE